MNKVKDNKAQVKAVKDELINIAKDEATHIMDDGKVDLEDAKRVGKHIAKSRTFWINLVAIATIFVQSKYGYIIDEDIQMQILGFINIGLRAITKEPVSW